MAAPLDKDYVTACGRLATALSISIASARRKVDLVAAREGVRDAEGRTLIAQRLLLESEGVDLNQRDPSAVLNPDFTEKMHNFFYGSGDYEAARNLVLEQNDNINLKLFPTNL